MKVSRKIQGGSIWMEVEAVCILSTATSKWELVGLQDASIAGTEPTGSHTRAIPPSFNSGWQVNSFPRAFSLPSRNGAIPRGKIDPFPGFPTGSAGSYITDGHLYISNSALRPASFESSIARLFDLPGIQICWLWTEPSPQWLLR